MVLLKEEAPPKEKKKPTWLIYCLKHTLRLILTSATCVFTGKKQGKSTGNERKILSYLAALNITRYLVSYFNKVVITEYSLKKWKTKIQVLPSRKIESIQ